MLVKSNRTMFDRESHVSPWLILNTADSISVVLGGVATRVDITTTEVQAVGVDITVFTR